MTALVSPQAANIERVGFAVFGIVIEAIEDAGTAAGASGPQRAPGRAARRGHQEYRGGGQARNCGKCGESGHSIRTCRQMKAVSAAGLNEVKAGMAKLKSPTPNKLPSSEFGLPMQRK